MLPIEISGAELFKKIHHGEASFLVDIREGFELRDTGIIEGSVHIPLSQLDAESIEKTGAQKENHIIFICRSGNRSLVAKNIGDSLGYKNTQSLRGGIVEWKLAYRPVVGWSGE